ncbi:hypothetical protein LOAG_13366, partial [Loa loa]
KLKWAMLSVCFSYILLLIIAFASTLNSFLPQMIWEKNRVSFFGAIIYKLLNSSFVSTLTSRREKKHYTNHKKKFSLIHLNQSIEKMDMQSIPTKIRLRSI